MAFDPSKLFRRADEVLRLELEQAWQRSPLGSLVGTIRRVSSGDPTRLLRRLERGATLRELMGTSLWEITGAIERYAGRSEWSLVKQFLRSLGPIGALLESLFSPLGRRPFQAPGFRLSLVDAINLLRGFGFEVLPPPEIGLPREEMERSVWAAYEFLRAHEDMLVGGPRLPAPPAGQAEEELQERRTAGLPAGADTVMVPMRFGGPQEFPATHPLVTGEMVEVRSSNVHSIGYDVDNQTLYVRFWATRVRRGQEVRFPGSLYGYRDVWPEEFLDFLDAASKGNWVWDHLRERGTVSGHKKPYFLAGIVGGYVPRQAALARIAGPKTGRLYPAEVFRPRVVFHQGRWLPSKLPLEVVQVFKVVKPPAPSLRPLLGL